MSEPIASPRAQAAEAEPRPFEDLFEIHKIALSLIRPKKEGDLETHEVKLSSWRKESDRQAVDRFLRSHLARAWMLPHSNGTRAARFEKGSLVESTYEKLKELPGQFSKLSGKLAEHLGEHTPPNASKGILVSLWYEGPVPGNLGLGLFKLDPGPRDIVVMQPGKGEEFLLELAVHHFAHALPQPGGRVLKWALVPHPDPQRWDVKLRDEQDPLEPAKYFQTFVGCKVEPSAPPVRRFATTTVRDVVKGAGPFKRPAIRGVIKHAVLKAKKANKPVSGETIIEQALKKKLITQEEADELQGALEQAGLKDWQLSPEEFERLRMTYLLDGGIEISGRLTDVLSLVDIARDNSHFRFCVTSKDYDVDVT